MTHFNELDFKIAKNKFHNILAPINKTFIPFKYLTTLRQLRTLIIHFSNNFTILHRLKIYFSMFLVSQVAISLGIFAVDYPPLFGLCAIQLPMISGFLNPLLCGILWPPYRRAYIRALKWPGTKCCNRKSSSRTRSHTLNCKYKVYLILWNIVKTWASSTQNCKKRNVKMHDPLIYKWNLNFLIHKCGEIY